MSQFEYFDNLLRERLSGASPRKSNRASSIKLADKVVSPRDSLLSLQKQSPGSIKKPSAPATSGGENRESYNVSQAVVQSASPVG